MIFFYIFGQSFENVHTFQKEKKKKPNFRKRVLEACVRFLMMDVPKVFGHTLSVGYLDYFQFSPTINNVELAILFCKPLVTFLIIPPLPSPPHEFLAV